ncbi:MAG: hypothetical protein V4673_14470 [Pseudomonadota bacterium]
MGTPTRLTTVPFNQPGENPHAPAAYVSSKLLAAATAESITIPAGVNIVRIAATADIFYSFSGTATVPGDVDDGTACELIKTQCDPEWRMIPAGATALSVISAGTPIVTASFFTM